MKKEIRTERGFTLLEMLIAVLLMGVIALIITGTMRISHRSVEKGEHAIEFLERIRTTSSLLDSQIQSAFSPVLPEDGNRKGYFSGSPVSLQISTNFSLWRGQSGYVVSTYSVEENNGKADLRITERTPGIEGEQNTHLMKNLDEIYFRYFRKTADSEHGEWSGEWKEEGTLPDKIMVHIRQGGKGFDFFVPLRVQGPDSWTLLQKTSRTGTQRD